VQERSEGKVQACARCDFYTPEDSSKAQLLEAKTSLQRMTATIPLTEEERAAVEDGQAALDQLLARLANVPTPRRPHTPRPRNRHQSPAHRHHHHLKRRNDLTTEDLVLRITRYKYRTSPEMDIERSDKPDRNR
jgi:hypothetical protein